MTNPKILPKQILREIIELHILRPQPIRRRNPTHTRHLMHIHQRPTTRKECVFLAIQEHHTGNNTHIMLPAVAELVPPFSLYDGRRVDLIDGPEVGVAGVEEDGLEDVIVIGDGGFIGIVIHAELVLVVCAVEGHFDFVHVFGVGVRVVHGSVAWGFAVWAFAFVLGEGNLVFLLFVFWFGAEVGVEVGFVILLEVLGVGVGNGDVVEEFGASKDELFAPGGGFAEEFEGVIGEDTHN